ncbi:MAG: hypothetical protein AAF702_41070 [Chloroflexota bacterium]
MLTRLRLRKILRDRWNFKTRTTLVVLTIAIAIAIGVGVTKPTENIDGKY